MDKGTLTVNEEYAFMTTPLGFLPINSTSMRALVDEINGLNDLIKNLNTQIRELEQLTNNTITKLLDKRIEQLISGPGGIMEMKQTIADKESNIERLEATLREIADHETCIGAAYYMRVIAHTALEEN